ncbi:MAG: hypothetical protein IE931_07695 [Sphingobacteriales bacterium]|nr:hypothetical protein [Sphingobacteriales bacterium]
MKYFLTLLFISITQFLFGFQNPDTLAYNLQRNKINQMLDARFQKFGQFEESLAKKSGIFGLKTKRDMQKSIDILTDIIQTDNHILKETKILLDFKNFQQEQIEQKSQNSADINLAYMKTINKLQQETEKLHQQLQDTKKSQKFYQILAFALGLAIASIVLFVFRKISTK